MNLIANLDLSTKSFEGWVFFRESYTPSIHGSIVCNSDLGSTMTDLLILPRPGYSEASLLGSFRTSNDALDSFKQQHLRYTKNLIIGLLNRIPCEISF